MNGDLQAELDALAATLGRSVSLDDPVGGLICYSAQDDDVDPVRVSAILARRVPADIQSWQNQHGIATATAPVRIPANPKLRMGARLCVPVRRQRTRLGYLWITEGAGRLDQALTAQAVRSARRIARMLDDPGGVRTTRPVDRVFAALLDDPKAPRGLLEELERALPALFDKQVRIAVAVTATADRSALSRDLLPTASSMSLALRQCRAVVATHVDTDRAAALLIGPTPAPPSPPAALADALTRWETPERIFTIGVSEPAVLAEGALTTAYRQAAAAAECAAYDPALPAHLSWANLGIYQWLLAATPHAVPSSALAPLQRHARSAAMLTHTLETYLDFAGDARRTAELLNLHRTTLYWRLNRIASILGADLSDGLTRTLLHIELKQRRLQTAQLRAPIA
jgi:PucR family transcriptional regulator, proline-responsive transcriptional activator